MVQCLTAFCAGLVLKSAAACANLKPNDQWLISDAGGGSVYITDLSFKHQLLSQTGPSLLASANNRPVGRWVATAVPDSDDVFNVRAVGSAHERVLGRSWLGAGGCVEMVEGGATRDVRFEVCGKGTDGWAGGNCILIDWLFDL